MYTIHIPLQFKCAQKTKDRNWVERIEYLLLFLYSYGLDPFGDVSNDLVIIIRRLISQAVYQVVQHFPEAVVSSVDYRQVIIALVFASVAAVSR